MSGWKQPFLLSRNRTELNACVMILETNRVEGEEFLYYSYKTNDQCNNLLNLKGIILASMGISHSIFCEDYRVMVLEEISNKTNNESVKYKATSRSYLKNYMISVIMPFMTPDNILVYVCKELAEFITIFFERFEETSKFTDILNKYCEVLLFNTINYAISKEKEDSESTPLSLMPVMNITFSYNEIWPCFLVKPPINDNLRTELIEIMNTLNSDRSVLQETLTLNDPPFYIRGFALLFGGFVMFNSLSNKELSSLSRLAMLHEMFIRSQSSSELLSCEFLFETEDFDDLSRIQRKNDDKKKIIVTILAQREFVLLISLDILGKNNCSFDPFYHKRAEDLVTSLLKKGYNVIIKNELQLNSIQMVNDNNPSEEKIISDMDSEIYIPRRRNSESSSVISSNIKKQSKTKLPIVDSNITTSYLNSKIKGYIDIETKVNIIHFSCYDDAECIINTTDLNISSTISKEIYRSIFREYARIQSNINKLKNRNKLLRLRKIYQYDNISQHYTNVLKREAVIKTKMQKELFLKNLSVMKINEYAFKLILEGTHIWVCCKIYEHATTEDETNLDEYSNFKIIFVTYESQSPVDIDSFCQDLMINELFI